MRDVGLGWGRERWEVVRTAAFVERALGTPDVTVPGEEVLLQREGHHADGGDDMLAHVLEVLQKALHRRCLRLVARLGPCEVATIERPTPN